MESALTGEVNLDIPGVRAELGRILASEAFGKAPRQRELLVYVVDATLNGRDADLVGKNIAENVFGIDPTSPRDVSTVRVEVGRLRRRLHRYYLEEGQANPARIDIPKGGYALSFAAATSTLPPDGDPPRRKVAGQLAMAGIALAIFAVGLWVAARISGVVPAALTPQHTGAVEAYSMFFEARSLGNPPYMAVRVEAAMALAGEIQQIDPGFGGGYAAESLQLWNYVLFGHSTDPDADALRALELARKAVELDPEFSWGQHALAQALHINKDLAGAIGASRRAVDLDPGEPDHHGYLGLFLALSGDGAEGAKHTTTAVELSDSVRAPYRNFLGIAHFHARQFDQAAEAIQRNRDDGGPTGPHMLLFLAASNALANHDGRAAAAAQLVRNDDSGFEPMPFVDGLYEISTERDLLLNGLAQAGVTFVPHE